MAIKSVENVIQNRNTRDGEDLSDSFRPVKHGFAAFLARMMKVREFNPTDLSALANVSRQSVYRHLDGTTKPDAQARAAYAAAFGLTLHAFDAMWQSPPERQTKAQASRSDPFGIKGLSVSQLTALIAAAESELKVAVEREADE